MWFGNLPTSTKLQGFYYYQGKIQSAATIFLSLKKRDNNKPKSQNCVFYHLCTEFTMGYKMGQKNFLEVVAPRPPRGLSMSTPAWACRPKPPLHGLSLKKSLIKKSRNIIRIESGRQIG